MKTTSLDELKDKFIGKENSSERMQYEQELQLEVLGELIKRVRKERKLTQEQLGELIGVKKAQISKLERNSKNVTIETILKVFSALKTKVSFKIDFLDETDYYELA